MLLAVSFSHAKEPMLRFSSGEKGLKVFDLRTFQEIKPPRRTNTSLRQITAVRWITGPEDPWEALCFGDVRGNVSVWRQNVRLVSGSDNHSLSSDTFYQCCFEEIASHRSGNGYEILSIGSDRTQRCTFRIAIGHRDQVVQAWKLDADSHSSSSEFVPLYSIRLEKSVPICSVFYGPCNDSLDPRRLLVLTGNDGMM